MTDEMGIGRLSPAIGRGAGTEPMDVDFVAVYEKWARQELTQPQAAHVLGMSERTFRRRIVRYRAEGLKGLEDRRVVVCGAASSEIAALTSSLRNEIPVLACTALLQGIQRRPWWKPIVRLGQEASSASRT